MHFTKMQGTGNDFIVINNMELKLPVSSLSALAARVCTRCVSLGGNALMVADTPTEGGDLKMRFYNADGTEGEMCGNGARCLARYAYEKGLAGAEVCIETLAGKVYGWRQDKRLYKIRLNNPSVLCLDYPVEQDGVSYDCAYVELGNPGIPHAVVRIRGLVNQCDDALRPLGAALRAHPAFPKGANINFYDMQPDGTIAVLTFERGVEDFTLACGTGSGSTAAVAILKGLTSAMPVQLHMPGGLLQVEPQRAGDAITALYLIGDTNMVAEGELTDEDLAL